MRVSPQITALLWLLPSLLLLLLTHHAALAGWPPLPSEFLNKAKGWLGLTAKEPVLPAQPVIPEEPILPAKPVITEEPISQAQPVRTEESTRAQAAETQQPTEDAFAKLFDFRAQHRGIKFYGFNAPATNQLTEEVEELLEKLDPDLNEGLRDRLADAMKSMGVYKMEHVGEEEVSGQSGSISSTGTVLMRLSDRQQRAALVEELAPILQSGFDEATELLAFRNALLVLRSIQTDSQHLGLNIRMLSGAFQSRLEWLRKWFNEADGLIQKLDTTRYDDLRLRARQARATLEHLEAFVKQDLSPSPPKPPVVPPPIERTAPANRRTVGFLEAPDLIPDPVDIAQEYGRRGMVAHALRAARSLGEQPRKEEVESLRRELIYVRELMWKEAAQQRQDYAERLEAYLAIKDDASADPAQLRLTSLQLAAAYQTQVRHLIDLNELVQALDRTPIRREDEARSELLALYAEELEWTMEQREQARQLLRSADKETKAMAPNLWNGRDDRQLRKLAAEQRGRGEEGGSGTKRWGWLDAGGLRVKVLKLVSKMFAAKWRSSASFSVHPTDGTPQAGWVDGEKVGNSNGPGVAQQVQPEAAAEEAQTAGATT